jgi:hypothetical protein
MLRFVFYPKNNCVYHKFSTITGALPLTLHRLQLSLHTSSLVLTRGLQLSTPLLFPVPGLQLSTPLLFPTTGLQLSTPLLLHSLGLYLSTPLLPLLQLYAT